MKSNIEMKKMQNAGFQNAEPKKAKPRNRWKAIVEMDFFSKPGLTVYEKLVYTLLCGFADADGASFPSTEKLAALAGCSGRQVQRATASLEAKGIIIKEARYNDKGEQTSNLYRVVAGSEEPSAEARTSVHGAAPASDMSTCTSGKSNTSPSSRIKILQTAVTERPARPDHSSYKHTQNNIKNNTAASQLEPTASDAAAAMPDFEDIEAPHAIHSAAEESFNFDEETETASEPFCDFDLAPDLATDLAPGFTTDYTPDLTADPVADPDTVCGGSLFAGVPYALRHAAEFLLLKTGRKFLSKFEIPALVRLEARHLPSRIMAEICAAAARFIKSGRNLASLTFSYIERALANQQSRSKSAPKAGSSAWRPRRGRACSAYAERAANEYDEEIKRLSELVTVLDFSTEQ